MLDPATLQAQLNALYKAYNSGAQRVQYEGKSVDYRDASEMRAAIAAIENQLNGMTGANTPRTILVRSRKGW
jgi:hypothetical protein